jgi:anti-anti-sigma regulatory factor
MSQDQRERAVSTLSSAREPPSDADTQSVTDQFVVTVSGRFDPASWLLVALTIATAVASGRTDALIDLDRLDAIDPDDVGILVRARTHLRSQQQRLVVRSLLASGELITACALVDPFTRASTMVVSREW